MSSQIEEQRPTTLVTDRSGQIVATGVTFEEYMEQYAEDHHELINGVVYKMSPISERHDKLNRYLEDLLDIYFELNPIGVIRQDPFAMKMDQDHAREPDLMVILNTNLDRLKPTFMEGPADICIEILSPGTVQVDLVEKFAEYEHLGVPEYWIFDPLHKEARFLRLNAEGRYEAQRLDSEGNYRTPALPGLVLNVPALWEEKLPQPLAIGELVKKMLNK